MATGNPSDLSVDAPKKPLKNKNKQTKFPVARIKKIMQKDEEVGKVAQATPIVISKALELFLGLIVEKSSNVTANRGSKKVEAYHLKHAVDTTEILDFLKEIVQAVPDPSAGGTIDLDNMDGEGGGKKRRSRNPATSAAGGVAGAGVGRGGGRGKRGANAAASANSGADEGESAPVVPAPRKRRKKAEILAAKEAEAAAAAAAALVSHGDVKMEDAKREEEEEEESLSAPMDADEGNGGGDDGTEDERDQRPSLERKPTRMLEEDDSGDYE